MKRTTTPTKWVADHVDVEKLFNEVNGVREIFDIENYENEDYYNHENHTLEYYCFDLVSGAYGQYQTEAIAECFGVEFEKDEDDHFVGVLRGDWEQILDAGERFSNEVTDILTDQFQTKFKAENNGNEITGSFYFSYLEADGSYGLFYVEDIESLENTREEVI